MTAYLIATFIFNLLQFIVALQIPVKERHARWAVIVFGFYVVWGGILIFT